MRRRLYGFWIWYSFAVRDNGPVGYLRHLREFERTRRAAMRAW